MANLKDRFKTFIQKTFFKEEYEERIKTEKLKAKTASHKRAMDRLQRKIDRNYRYYVALAQEKISKIY